MGEGAAPKSEMQRGCGTRQVAVQSSSAKRRPPHHWWPSRGGWGGDAQLRDRLGWGVPQAEAPLLSSAGPPVAARGLYTLRLRGYPPFPTPRSPASSTLAQATSYICKYGEGLGLPPAASSGLGGLFPTPTLGLEQGREKEYNSRLDGVEGKITPKRLIGGEGLRRELEGDQDSDAAEDSRTQGRM